MGGCYLRYFHSNGASFVFIFVYLHFVRAMYYNSYYYNRNTWLLGIIILLLLMVIAFIGYILPFGQMSFLGATVIINLLLPFISLIEYISGGYCFSNPTLKRFFIFHFLLPFILFGFVFIHIFYLHLLSSNNPLSILINNKIPFLPYIFIKDVFSLIIILFIYLIQINYGICLLSHPDNSLEACILVTPLHIVPE